MNLSKLIQGIAETKETNLRLYFITRVLKSEFKKSSKVLDKYNFKVYQVDVNSEIRNHLHSLTLEQLGYLKNKKNEISDYDVMDETDHILTYQMSNKVMSFADVVNQQLSQKSKIPRIANLESLVLSEELWAYCVGLYAEEQDEWIYTFRKILAGKIAVDEKDSNSKSQYQKVIRTIFSTKSNRLELVHGQTINLDKQIDCIFYKNVFYIMHKRKFEQITGLDEEYKGQAIQIADELKATNMFEGINLILDQINSNPSIHKKLVRLSRIGNYQDLNEKSLRRMKAVAKAHGENLKTKDGKFLLENDADIDVAFKMLGDYYKAGEVSGKSYGTFSGKLLQVNE